MMQPNSPSGLALTVEVLDADNSDDSEDVDEAGDVGGGRDRVMNASRRQSTINATVSSSADKGGESK